MSHQQLYLGNGGPVRSARPTDADIREERVIFGKTDSDRGRERERRERSKKRRMNWAPPDVISSTGLHAIPFNLPGGLSMEQQEALLLRCRLEEINKKLNQRELDMDTSDDRSPSPEPIYDDKGKRINTREQRAKDKIQEELNKLVDNAFLMEPKFKPPPNYDPNAVKKMRKIFIPCEKYPGYNFIGLIIGPRGNTQKRMEKETGCKISIRGKGSVKEGKNKKPSPGDDEDQHVLIMGTTDTQVNKAAKMIRELLVPVDEDKNEHKRQQLRELAEINGTLVNRSWQGTMDLSYRRTDICCAICGDKSHPTADCSLRGSNMPSGGGAVAKTHIESQYDAFLSEIGEAPPPPPPSASQPTPSSAAAAYAEFQASISSITSDPAPPPPPPSSAHPQNQQSAYSDPATQAYYQQYYQQQAGHAGQAPYTADPAQAHAYQYQYQQQPAYGSVPPPASSYYNQ